jgi:hypothetical protein
LLVTFGKFTSEPLVDSTASQFRSDGRLLASYTFVLWSVISGIKQKPGKKSVLTRGIFPFAHHLQERVPVLFQDFDYEPQGDQKLISDLLEDSDGNPSGGARQRQVLWYVVQALLLQAISAAILKSDILSFGLS